MLALGFRKWLFLTESWQVVAESRQAVDSEIVQSYQRAFAAGVDDLAKRTDSPELRDAIASLRTYPFANQIVGAFVNSGPGCFRRYDPEEVLQYIAFQMLSPVGETGQRKQTIFDMDLSRPWDLERGSPLQARFLWLLRRHIAGICANKVPKLAYHERRPETVSISQGRRKGDRESGTISADEIPANTSEDRERELLDDVVTVLRSQEARHPELPILDVFFSTMRGEVTRQQRATWGRNRADRSRKTIIDTLKQWSAAEHPELQRLLKRFEGFTATRPDPSSPRSRYHRKPSVAAPIPKPQTLEDFIAKDIRSLVALMERLPKKELTLGLAGKYRRRNLERPPREADSPFPNRLASTLAHAVRLDVLELRQTRAGGKLYVPGPRYGEFVTPVPVKA